MESDAAREDRRGRKPAVGRAGFGDLQVVFLTPNTLCSLSPTMLSTLTRAQFEHACHRYVETHSCQQSEVKTHPSGWLWQEHPYVSGLGYLARTVYLPRTNEPEAEAETDDATELADSGVSDDESLAASPEELLACKQYIVYSPTFEVPAFYFTIHGSSGAPLPLNRITESTLFRRHALPSANDNTFALTLPDTSLALLSQGDHPTLGTPSWYLHPCHTSEAVGEILAESDGRNGENGLRWMEVWFMVMGNVVDFFAGNQ
ncbi:hypothetical protein C8Q78DRAFT_999764 [Trametes maxima]|nr:hypothetical protein C8Q78DRAFT_999764 [Trametes maxima]